MDFLWEGLLAITWKQAVMYLVGVLLIYLAVKKSYEPSNGFMRLGLKHRKRFQSCCLSVLAQ